VENRRRARRRDDALYALRNQRAEQEDRLRALQRRKMLSNEECNAHRLGEQDI
jgi:hypothetical protein